MSSKKSHHLKISISIPFRKVVLYKIVIFHLVKMRPRNTQIEVSLLRNDKGLPLLEMTCLKLKPFNENNENFTM